MGLSRDSQCAAVHAHVLAVHRIAQRTSQISDQVSDFFTPYDSADRDVFGNMGFYLSPGFPPALALALFEIGLLNFGCVDKAW